ncbi:hypothetical protein DL546_002438 [Coniochaeta pulveracea]|uniref:Helicase-like protein n=1 Tax=Coniochaeta pulveracea TaxID=177199 RepID=A0A420XY18_9PEZI|nr:hypothetical protein DL546_002438 [Coniochaeta pulveracea]
MVSRGLVPASIVSPTLSQRQTPLSPRSPVDSNKPLPFPPLQESEQTQDPAAKVKPVLKLERIMANLSDSEIEKLFSGAPQYFARSEGHGTGAPHPSVAFPWDEQLEIRDLTDHTQIEDRAWSCVTAWPHITRDVQPDRTKAQKLTAAKRRAHYYPRCRERPNMLSMSGLEKGSVGYAAALELGVADALEEEQPGFETLGSKSPVVMEHRQKMLTSREGLRHMDESAILEQLMKNGWRYTEKHLRARRVTSELYNELFLHMLHPPTKVLDHNDPYSLLVQIQALVKVLAAPNMWIDFSHVEWRIRLGQLLWSTEEDLDAGDSASIKSVNAPGELHEERYWLLLQILLASELLIRLDAITEGDELGLESVSYAETVRFEKEANRSVRWSLHLARAWLENIEVVRTETALQEQEKPAGWLATLTKRMSLSEKHPIHLGHHPGAAAYAIKGRHCDRQVEGLTHFARSLRWPGVSSYEERITENCRSLIDGEGLCHFLMSTLLENDQGAMSRLGTMANLCGGFVYSGKSFWSTACVVGRVLAAAQGSAECMGWVSSGITPNNMDDDGWLNIAVAPVPEDAQQMGHKKARLWHKMHVEKESNVLGDADPSMVLPADFIIPAENCYKEKPPPTLWIELNNMALWAPVDNESTPTTPTDENVQSTPFSDASTQARDILTRPAALNFTISQDDSPEVREQSFVLSHDVYFVTAHPCVPSQHVKIMKSATSPTIQQVDLCPSSTPGSFKTPGSMGKQPLSKYNRSTPRLTDPDAGHPLHKYYTYLPLHLSELLARSTSSLDDLLSTYPTTAYRPSFTPGSEAPAKFLVIDCITGFQTLPQEHEIPLSPTVSRSSITTINDFDMNAPSPTTPGSDAPAPGFERAGKKMHHETRRRQFGSDMEVLVRALCAERGWNALISRRRRGCLACAIREAGALGWKVVIRVE